MRWRRGRSGFLAAVIHARPVRRIASRSRRRMPRNYRRFSARSMTLKQPRVEWDCGTSGLGVLVSDSLMFQRGQPTPSDPWLGNVYGLAMPLIKRGILPVTPVQLGKCHPPALSGWIQDPVFELRRSKAAFAGSACALGGLPVKHGGVLVFCDRDADPYLQVRDWWNSDGNFITPRRGNIFLSNWE